MNFKQKLTAYLGLNTKEFDDKLKASTGKVNSFGATFGAIAGAVAMVGAALAMFAASAVKAALRAGDLSSAALDTALNMSKISTTAREIKEEIGEAILESKFWNFWTERLANTLTKVRNLFKADEGIKFIGIKKEDVDSMLKSIDAFSNKLVEQRKRAEEAAEAFKKLKEANYEWAFTQFKGLDISKAFPKQGVAGAGQARGGTTLAGAPILKDSEAITVALEKQQAVVGELTNAFANMFQSVDQGFSGMIDSMIESLKRWLVELMAKAAVFGLLQLIAPGTGLASMAQQGLWGMTGVPKSGGGSGLGLFKGLASAGQSQIIGQTTIYGKDLVTVLRRNPT